jgi:hypothetical protein
MKTKLLAGVATIFAMVAFANNALAKEEHTSAALEHATAAANATDSAGVTTHTTEALKHIDAAKTAHKPHPDMVEHISQGEIHLKASLESAGKGDAAAAAHHAAEAKKHLEAADK